jgi:hypothetical protein
MAFESSPTGARGARGAGVRPADVVSSLVGVVARPRHSARIAIVGRKRGKKFPSSRPVRELSGTNFPAFALFSQNTPIPADAPQHPPRRLPPGAARRRFGAPRKDRRRPQCVHSALESRRHRTRMTRAPETPAADLARRSRAERNKFATCGVRATIFSANRENRARTRTDFLQSAA